MLKNNMIDRILTLLLIAFFVFIQGACTSSPTEEPLPPSTDTPAPDPPDPPTPPVPTVEWKPAISWIDDDFSVFNSNHEVTAKYQILHDWCVEHDVYVDFALVPFAHPADTWVPKKRIATIQAWKAEGFGFLQHPVHSLGWYYYNAAHPHDANKVEESIIESTKAFALYGLDESKILVWPGNSYTFLDNYEIVQHYFDCAIISSYNGVNHKAENDRYLLKRLSFESLKIGELTKSQFKKRIRDAVKNGDWIIFGSHFYTIEVNDVPDETSYNTANVFELLEYADSLCHIRSTTSIWNERKHLFDKYENAVPCRK